MSGMLNKLAAFVAVLLLAVGGFGLTAFAQEANQVTLSVSPNVFELTANPGDTITESFRITNQSDKTLVLSAQPKNLLPNDEQGGALPTDEETTFSLASWITVSPTQVELEPNSIANFSFTINVPENAEPGTHLGAVLVSTQAEQLEGSGAKVSEEVGPLILLAVTGDLNIEGRIVEFTTDKSFYEGAPIKFITRIENTGNVHFKPRGTITIKNMFGNEVTKINLEEKNVLPDTIRRLESEWNPGFTVGRYTADLEVQIGDNPPVTSSVSFTVFPYKVIVPALLGGILLLWALLRYRSRFAEAFKVLAGKK